MRGYEAVEECEYAERISSMSIMRPALFSVMLFMLMGGLFATYCYQESANVSTACGGLATGTYLIDGGWEGNTWNLIDGDWDTGTNFSGTSEIYVNYTIPENFTNAVWLIRDEYTNASFNITNETCNLTGEFLELYIEASGSLEEEYSEIMYACVGSLAFLIVESPTSTPFFFFEEGIYWTDANLTVPDEPPTANPPVLSEIAISPEDGVHTYETVYCFYTANDTDTPELTINISIYDLSTETTLASTAINITANTSSVMGFNDIFDGLTGHEILCYYILSDGIYEDVSESSSSILILEGIPSHTIPDQHAVSDPHITGTISLLDFMNTITGGIFGIGIILALGIIIFMSLFDRGFEEAGFVASLFSTLICILGTWMNIVSPLYIVLFLALTCICVIALMKKRG